MSNQSKQLAELKQQILKEINEEELEACVGASESYTYIIPGNLPVMQPTGVNQNTGVNLHSGANLNQNTGVNLHSGANLNQNTGVRRPRT